MTVEYLARLVEKMRRAQRSYFSPKTRTPTSLDEAKRLEHDVDKAVADILDGAKLFD